LLNDTSGWIEFLDVFASGMIKSRGGGLSKGLLQFLELYRCDNSIGSLTALLVTVISVLDVSLNKDDIVWFWYLSDQVGILRNCHELGECRPPEECIVCRFKIGYFKLHVLSVEIFLSLESHGKSDLIDRVRCCPRDYSVEGSLTRTQCCSGQPHLVEGL
jgi:hypothetical protein